MGTQNRQNESNTKHLDKVMLTLEDAQRRRRQWQLGGRCAKSDIKARSRSSSTTDTPTSSDSDSEGRLKSASDLDDLDDSPFCSPRIMPQRRSSLCCEQH